MEKQRRTILYIILAAAILVSVLLFLGLRIAQPGTTAPSTQPSLSTDSNPTGPTVTTVNTAPTAPNNPTTPSVESTMPEEPEKVLIYQCDPDLAARWTALGKEYTELTGIQVTVLACEEDGRSISLEQALTQEAAPTIFCLHSMEEFARYQAYCLSLQGDPLLDELCRDIFTLSDEDGVWGVANNIESYGLIYNASLLARTGYTGSDIKDYDSLTNIAQFITKNTAMLGVSAFTSPDLSSTDHGSLLCLLSGLQASDSDLRSFWDLYTANDIAGSNSIQDFLDQKAVFYLGGTWDYEVLSPLTEMVENNLQMLPVYTSSDAEDLGLYHSCTGYWCVNRNASQADMAASLDFLRWLVTAPEGGTAPVDSLELLAPYKDAAFAGNPLEEVVRDYLAEDLHSVNWNNCDTLTVTQLAALGKALAAYDADPGDDTWAKVEQIFS